MFKNIKKHLIILVCCLLVTFGCLVIANNIQTDSGNVKVTMETIVADYTDYQGNKQTGTIVYKLYTPKEASANNKLPALLMLHGYQNDHETCDAYAIELARRGVVVMAIDEYGHGKTDISMVNRGYVNHKVTVNYGNDSKEEGTFVEISGQTRYKVLMNFSNLSFFNDKYSKDNDGNSIVDSSMGGIVAYAVLSNMDFVDSKNMAVSGHSMGTWASWSVSAAYAYTDIEPQATILQCGELFTEDAYDSEFVRFKNVLLLTSKYDEFNYFRDYSKKTVDDSVIQNKLSSEFLGVDENGEGEWNTTYGSFNDGTARRRQLLITNHRLATHDHKALQTSIEWLTEALHLNTTLKSTDHVYAGKELLVLVSTFSAIISMIALMNILLFTKAFASCDHQEYLEKRQTKKGWAYWKGAIITIAIACVTYPFMTQLGHGLLPLPDTTVFRMTIGNGFLSWYLILIIIMLVTTIVSFKSAKKKGKELTFVDLGLSTVESKNKIDWKLLFKSLGLAIIMVAFMYLQCYLAEELFMLDFRYIWPFFKSFNLERFAQFGVYIIIFLVFFLLNNSKIFAQNQPDGTTEKGIKGFLKCWYKNALCMIGGILVLILIEYIPFFIGAGPGVDLLFSSTFGGPFMSLMIVFVPQVLVFSLICTYTYRRTGSVYVGAFVVAMLACWIVTGGSAIL